MLEDEGLNSWEIEELNGGFSSKKKLIALKGTPKSC
jgi:hypothetical protein